MIKLLRRLERTRATPIYGIGAASRLSGLPIWTLRWIEKHALVRPSRTRGNQRAFSEEQVERLSLIRDLMEKKVNLAGIRMILAMRERDSSAGARRPEASRAGGISPTAPRSARAARPWRSSAGRS